MEMGRLKVLDEMEGLIDMSPEEADMNKMVCFRYGSDVNIMSHPGLTTVDCPKCGIRVI
jgi:hypothetical protein